MKHPGVSPSPLVATAPSLVGRDTGVGGRELSNQGLPDPKPAAKHGAFLRFALGRRV